MSLFDEVHAYCVSHADADRAGRYARYFTEGYDAYGVDHKAPDWEPTRLSWNERVRTEGFDSFVRCADQLVRTGKYEEASFAILMAADLKEFHSRDLFDAIGTWFDCGGMRNWGHVDVLCKMVLSRLFVNRVIGLSQLKPWRESPHKYKRRAVAVTLVESLEALDAAKWLAFVRPLMTDPEKVVHQGTGWFLREVWKRDPVPVESFLLEWKDTSPRLIFQYATEKMDKAAKERFRKTR